MKVRSSIADKILQILCIVLLAGTTFYLLAGWGTFPDKLPMHFGASGQIDKWGGKGILIFMLVMQWGLYLLCTGVEQIPQIWNTGVKVTAENRERVYRILKYMLETLKLAIEMIFTFLFVCITLARPLPGWSMPVMLALVFGDIAFWMILLWRCR
ncbi:DUF1648 domain-containing protein [uncultured Merdimonas sp.]|uniref:DUF1648 domain-containing protein n=1 Tax=uncultured Merdimonas sp. TaxID=2023269 RepID=UPI003207BEC9